MVRRWFGRRAGRDREGIRHARRRLAVRLTFAFREHASVIDSGDYGAPGQQSLEFSDLIDIVEASRDQHINTELIDVVQSFIRAARSTPATAAMAAHI